MRTLHVSSAISWRGGEQQIAYLLETLALKGHQQWVLCVKESMMEAYCTKHNIPHYSYKKLASVNPLIGKKIDILVETLKVDLVHLHDSHAHTYACIAASLFKMDVPVILSRRVDFPIRRNPLSKWKYNHPSIKKIICVSNFIQQVMLPDIKDPSKLTVVRSGVDLNRFKNSRKINLHKEFKISRDKTIIANVASIAPHKDYFTFVNTAAIIVKNHSDVHFLIIGGDGGEEEDIKNLITQKGLDDRITLTGFREDITDILPSIDILLLTSKTEGLGTSLLDAQLCEVPIVATATGGIPEVIQHEENGLLAPPRNPAKLAAQLERLIISNSHRKELSQNAKKTVQSFSKEAMTTQTIKVYETVLAERNSDLSKQLS